MVEPTPPSEPPRALTYTEMMNGGRTRMDDQAHARELELKRREATLEQQVAHLEQSFQRGQ